MSNQIYLGDGAYATIDRDYKGQIILTANHHDPALATDVIHLEPPMIKALAAALDAPQQEVTTDG